MSLLSSDCYFESLALQETFAGPQACPSLVLPNMKYTMPIRIITPLYSASVFQWIWLGGPYKYRLLFSRY